MRGMTFLIFWIVTEVGMLGFWIAAARPSWRDKSNWPVVIIGLTGVATIVPLIALSLFIMVFVIGGASNVAQLTSADRFQFFDLWFRAWPALYFTLPPSVGLFAITLALPPYRLRYGRLMVCRICGLVAAGCAWYAVVTYFPSA